MVLKRKRSSAELCSSPVSSPNANAAMMMMDVSPHSHFEVPANLHSRTFKRYRDCRPSDEEVHRKFYEWRAHHQESQNSCVPAERTLGLLYSAQQQQHPSPLQQSPFEAQQQVSEPVSSNNQQSLHRFWNINSAPSSAATSMTSIASTTQRPSSCEDCGAGLADGADGMELDGLAAGDTCGACGKHVCYSCSVSNLGEQKRCLQCAGRRVWIGGIGWTNVGVSVC